MEPIKTVVAKTLATLTQTQVEHPITKVSEKLIDWAFNANNPKTAQALASAQLFCSDMLNDRSPYWLALVGNSGTGKTHLARKVVEWFRLNLLGTQFVERVNHVACRDYRFRTWQKAMGQIYDGNYGVVDALSDEWLAIIDDVGAEHDPRKFGVSKLLEILEKRREKWTIITSNLLVPQIAEHLDTRLASRLIREGSKVVQLDCKDYNLKKIAV